MSQAEELLDSLPEEDYMVGSGDTERHVVIGRDRIAIVPEELKKIGVQHDHNIETITFDCPRYWDGHDMSLMKVYINYVLSDLTPGRAIASDPVVDEMNDQIMHFTWTISKNVTKVHGNFAFQACINSVDENGNEKNHWNSEPNSDMFIVKGLDCGSVSDDNQEGSVGSSKDIITELLVRMEKCESVLNMEWVEATDKAIADIKSGETIIDTYATKEELAEKVDLAGGTITGDLTVQGDMKLPNADLYDEVTTMSAGYSSRQTADGKAIVDGSFTEVKKIEGKTVKCNSNNLISFPYFDRDVGYTDTTNGITFTVNADGSITAKGTATAETYFQLCNVDFGVNSWYSMNGGTTNGFYFKDCNYNASNKYSYIVIAKGITVDTTYYPMVNEGTTALPYEPYFYGLKHAHISSIKSTGRNLIDIPDFELNGGAGPSVDLNLSGTVTLSFVVGHGESTLPTSAIVRVQVDGVDKYQAPTNVDNDGVLTLTVSGSKITELSFLNWSQTVGTISEVMLNYGSKALPYEPYKEEIYQLPEEVECGSGVRIDPAARKITRQYQELVIKASDHKFTKYSPNATTYTSGLNLYSAPKALHDGNSGRNIMVSTHPDLELTGASSDKSNYGTLVFFNTGCESIEEFAEKYLAKPLYVRYVTAAVQSEEDIDVPAGYEVYNGGSETIVQGDEDNSQWGAVLTVTQTYELNEDPTDVATKGFVRAGLAKKVDEELFETVIQDITNEAEEIDERVSSAEEWITGAEERITKVEEVNVVNAFANDTVTVTRVTVYGADLEGNSHDDPSLNTHLWATYTITTDVRFDDGDTVVLSDANGESVSVTIEVRNNEYKFTILAQIPKGSTGLIVSTSAYKFFGETDSTLNPPASMVYQVGIAPAAKRAKSVVLQSLPVSNAVTEPGIYFVSHGVDGSITQAVMCIYDLSSVVKCRAAVDSVYVWYNSSGDNKITLSNTNYTIESIRFIPIS